jgi:NAD-dependent SIR2 family protein deacetylase
MIAELHGNTNLEYCRKCGKEFMRDFSVRNKNNKVHDHVTFRNCNICGE